MPLREKRRFREHGAAVAFEAARTQSRKYQAAHDFKVVLRHFLTLQHTLPPPITIIITLPPHCRHHTRRRANTLPLLLRIQDLSLS